MVGQRFAEFRQWQRREVEADKTGAGSALGEDGIVIVGDWGWCSRLGGCGGGGNRAKKSYSTWDLSTKFTRKRNASGKLADEKAFVFAFVSAHGNATRHGIRVNFRDVTDDV